MKLDDAKLKTPSQGLRRRKAEESVETGRPSLLNESNRPEIRYISAEALIPYHKQARRSFDQDQLNRLADTIKAYGIRQPLTVIASEKYEGLYEIVSGERRFRAAKQVGLTRLPCILLPKSKEAEEVALVENVQRKDLHPLELGDAYKKLLENGVCSTQKEVADKLGVSRTQVAEYISFTSLPHRVREALMSQGVGARRILRSLHALSLKEGVTEESLLHALSGMMDKHEKSTSSAPSKKKVARKLLFSVHLDETGVLFDHGSLKLKDVESLEILQTELEKALHFVKTQMKIVGAGFDL